MTLTPELEARLRETALTGSDRSALLGEIDRLRAMTQWQPIETAQKDRWVLVNNGGVVEVARLYSTGRWFNVAEFESSCVHHWMPLPAAPKTDGS